MPPFNIWTLAAFLSVMALLATLRLSSISWAERKLTGPLAVILSPIWLTPLIFGLAWTIGLIIKGSVSAWPPTAMQQGVAYGGYWAGLTALFIVIVAELWLVWTGANIALRYSPPEKRIQIKHLPILSIVLGGGFLFWMWTIHH